MAPLFFSRCVWQRIISLKLQFDWECDDKPVDLAVYSILGQTHAIQTAINKNACPTYLPIIHWLLCIHIQYITLFIPKISHGFLHPPFFLFHPHEKTYANPSPPWFSIGSIQIMWRPRWGLCFMGVPLAVPCPLPLFEAGGGWRQWMEGFFSARIGV